MSTAEIELRKYEPWTLNGNVRYRASSARLMHPESDEQGTRRLIEMKRSFAIFATAAFALAGLTVAAPTAQAEYPDKPIKVMVGFPPGGGADILVRWYADQLQKASGGTFIVENKVGASGNLSLDAVAKARPDGYTILFASTVTTAGNAHVFKTMPLDVRKDLVPVMHFGETPFVLCVAPNSPINTVADLTAFIKTKGGKATYGTATTIALAATIIYLDTAKVEATQVGYKTTANAITDLTAGQIDFAFADVVFATGQAKQGRIKMIAITSDTPAPSLPNVPPMKAAGVPLGEITPLWGVWVPAGAPKEVVDKLSKWMIDITNSPAAKDFLHAQGATPVVGDQASYRKRFDQAWASWDKVVATGKVQAQ
jgi:tripartite-type tricarboxylate transporter receptor subunit TctC